MIVLCGRPRNQSMLEILSRMKGTVFPTSFGKVPVVSPATK